MCTAAPTVHQSRLGGEEGFGAQGLGRETPEYAVVSRCGLLNGGAQAGRRLESDRGHHYDQSLNCAGGSYNPSDHVTRSPMLRAASSERSASIGSTPMSSGKATTPFLRSWSTVPALTRVPIGVALATAATASRRSSRLDARQR